MVAPTSVGLVGTAAGTRISALSLASHGAPEQYGLLPRRKMRCSLLRLSWEEEAHTILVVITRRKCCSRFGAKRSISTASLLKIVAESTRHNKGRAL